MRSPRPRAAGRAAPCSSRGCRCRNRRRERGSQQETARARPGYGDRAAVGARPAGRNHDSDGGREDRVFHGAALYQRLRDRARPRPRTYNEGMRIRSGAAALLFALLFAYALSTSPVAAATPPVAIVAEYEGIIHPIAAEFIDEVITRADTRGAAVTVIV